MFSCLNPHKLSFIRPNKILNIRKCFHKNTGKSKSNTSLKNEENVVSIAETVASNVGVRSLIKPFLFTVSFSGCCFFAASIWQYENMRRGAWRFHRNALFDSIAPTYKRLEVRRKLNSWWNSQTEGQKVASVIIGVNVFVFLLWRIPYLNPVMRKYFCSTPAISATCWPMVLSTFSHYSFFHLAANMYVLYSFSTAAVAYFGKEQFMALYGSAGVISSFTSYVFKVLSGRCVMSLGASGALMAVLSSTCFQFPNAELAIVFLPFFTFPAGLAIKGVMTLDLVGLIAKWKLFDHAAHLGGATVGILYLYYGQEYIWNKREPIFAWYHNIRNKKEK